MSPRSCCRVSDEVTDAVKYAMKTTLANIQITAVIRASAVRGIWSACVASVEAAHQQASRIPG